MIFHIAFFTYNVINFLGINILLIFVYLNKSTKFVNNMSKINLI